MRARQQEPQRRKVVSRKSYVVGFFVNKGCEDLEVWRRSKNLSVEIHKITKSFSPEDRFSLTSQLRRSSVSVLSNIAEGATKKSKKEFRQFILIAHGSCSELITQLIISYEIGNIEKSTFNKLDSELQIIGRMLKGLERSLEK